MNPNSQNQTWSLWVFFVVPGGVMSTSKQDFEDFKFGSSCLARSCFGSPSQMRVRQTLHGYILEILTEGHPVQEDSFRDAMFKKWDEIMKKSFGPGTTVTMRAKLMAGAREGKPPDQMIIVNTAGGQIG